MACSDEQFDQPLGVHGVDDLKDIPRPTPITATLKADFAKAGVKIDRTPAELIGAVMTWQMVAAPATILTQVTRTTQTSLGDPVIRGLLHGAEVFYGEETFLAHFRPLAVPTGTTFPESELAGSGPWWHDGTQDWYFVTGISTCSTNGPRDGKERVVHYYSQTRKEPRHREIGEFLDGRFLPLRCAPAAARQQLPLAIQPFPLHYTTLGPAAQPQPAVTYGPIVDADGTPRSATTWWSAARHRWVTVVSATPIVEDTPVCWIGFVEWHDPVAMPRRCPWMRREEFLDEFTAIGHVDTSLRERTLPSATRMHALFKEWERDNA